MKATFSHCNTLSTRAGFHRHHSTTATGIIGVIPTQRLAAMCKYVCVDSCLAQQEVQIAFEYVHGEKRLICEFNGKNKMAQFAGV